MDHRSYKDQYLGPVKVHRSMLCYRGGGFRVKENLNLPILEQQNLCHFLKLREQNMQGWQNLLMRNSGRLLLF